MILNLTKGIKLHETEIWYFWLPEGFICQKVASAWF